MIMAFSSDEQHPNRIEWRIERLINKVMAFVSLTFNKIISNAYCLFGFEKSIDFWTKFWAKRFKHSLKLNRAFKLIVQFLFFHKSLSDRLWPLITKSPDWINSSLFSWNKIEIQLGLAGSELNGRCVSFGLKRSHFKFNAEFVTEIHKIGF